MEQEQFVKYPLVLMKSTGYVSEKTGEFVKLSLAEKQIYIYMKNRFDFFVRENKGEYYDSQVDIADCCGVEVKTVQRTVKKDSVKVVNICDYSDLPPWEQSGYSFYEDREPIF